MRYLFELSFHTNYFEENEYEPARFTVVAFEVTKKIYEDTGMSSGPIVELYEDIEGNTVTHDYYGQEDDKWSRTGYSIYETDVIEDIVEEWTEGLKSAYGSEVKDPIRYSFVSYSADDYEVNEAAAFDAAFGDAMENV